MKRIISIITLVGLILAACVFGACESGGGSGEGGVDDGENPAMNFIGRYACDRASILFEAGEGSTARATVTWGSSARETSTWVMSGVFDVRTLTMEYTNCVRKDSVYSSDGSLELDNIMYEEGSGRIVFQDDGTLIWEDDQEHMADGMVFQFITNEIGE